MRWVISSTSVLDRTDSPFFATIFGARQTVVKPGRNCKPTKAPAAATRNGSPSIRLTARAMVSSTRPTTALTAAAVAWNSSAPPTAASPGRVQLTFPMGLCTERSMWTRTATCLSGARGTRRFTASARAMRRSGARRQLLIEAPP